MSELKMQRSGKVLHSHESPSFELKKKKRYTDWKLYKLSRSTWLISLHQAFSAVSCLWKAAPFSFSRTNPCLSRDSRSPREATEVTRGGDELGGMLLSGLYLYSQEEPKVHCYHLFNLWKLQSHQQQETWQHHLSHSPPKQKGRFLSALCLLGLWKIHQFREKNCRNRKPHR